MRSTKFIPPLLLGLALACALPASADQEAPQAPSAAQVASAPSSPSAPKPPRAASAASAASAPEPIRISVDDPAMRTAIRKARATLNKFLPIAAKNDPNNQAVSLKIAIRDGDKIEHVWVTPFKVVGKRFSGTVIDKPELVTTVKQGEQRSFGRQDIVDWMYYDTAGGVMHGNYSTCAKLTKAPKEDTAEMERIYGLDCNK